MIEINVVQQQLDRTIKAGTGAADTAGGSLSGAVSDTAADVTAPESQRQYDLRDVADKLPVKGIYARPCVWSDVLYWMDS